MASSGEKSAQKALEKVLAAWDAQAAAERDLKTAHAEYLSAGKDGLEELSGLIVDNRGAVNNGRAAEVLGDIIEKWDARDRAIAAALEKKQGAKTAHDERWKAFLDAMEASKQGTLGF